MIKNCKVLQSRNGACPDVFNAVQLYRSFTDYLPIIYRSKMGKINNSKLLDDLFTDLPIIFYFAYRKIISTSDFLHSFFQNLFEKIGKSVNR